MSNFAENYPWMIETRYLGPAQVLGIDNSGNRVRLRLGGALEDAETWARVAISGSAEFNPGDTALVIGEDMNDLYVIGILSQKQKKTMLTKKITLDGGTYAEVKNTPDTQALQIRSKKQELLFEYDEKKCKARVNLESGDLEFVTKNGNISFDSGRDILLNGQSVGITSRSGIIMGLVDALGKIRSSFTLKPDKVKLYSPNVGINAQAGELKIDEVKYVGKYFSGKVEFSKLAIDRMETVVETMVLKAKNIYKTVEQLTQLKTGRLRTLVQSTFHLKSKKSFLKTEEDFKVRADKIHLG